MVPIRYLIAVSRNAALLSGSNVVKMGECGFELYNAVGRYWTEKKGGYPRTFVRLWIHADIQSKARGSSGGLAREFIYLRGGELVRVYCC